MSGKSTDKMLYKGETEPSMVTLQLTSCSLIVSIKEGLSLNTTTRVITE